MCMTYHWLSSDWHCLDNAYLRQKASSEAVTQTVSPGVLLMLMSRVFWRSQTYTALAFKGCRDSVTMCPCRLETIYMQMRSY